VKICYSSWSDIKRAEDPSFFCRAAIEKAIKNQYNSPFFNLWIVTDARRKTDLLFFAEKYPQLFKTVRVHADNSVRIQRNWIFTEGINKLS
jgi:phosphomevalonate kinase